MSESVEDAVRAADEKTVELFAAVSGNAMSQAVMVSNVVMRKFCDLLRNCETMDDLNKLLDEAMSRFEQ